MAKPFVKWAGGKTQLLSQYKSALPFQLDAVDNFTYIEPFVGGGAMLFYILQNFPNVGRVVINDINPNLVTTYKVVRDCSKLLIDKLKEYKALYNSFNDEVEKMTFFLKIRKKYNEEQQDDVTKAAMFIFLNKTCFNGLHRVNSKGYFNVPFGRYANPTICDEALIEEDSYMLRNVTILCGDYTQIEPMVDERTFIYFDPPYRPISTTSSFTSYSKEDFDDAEQIRLARFYKKLSQRGCKMLLSNSDSSSQNPNDTFFEDLYEDFVIERVFASRSVNSNPTKRGKLSEIIVRNYDSTIGNCLVNDYRLAVL